MLLKRYGNRRVDSVRSICMINVLDVDICICPDSISLAIFQDPAIAFAKKGYHILLEKPMAVSFSDFLFVSLVILATIVMLQ